MDILEALKMQKERPTLDVRSRKIMQDGLWSISDAVFQSTLYRLGVDNATIQECMEEPLDSRSFYLNYFEEKYNDKNIRTTIST